MKMRHAFLGLLSALVFVCSVNPVQAKTDWKPAVSVAHFQIAGEANIPRPQCPSGSSPFLQVFSAEVPSASWPIQVEVDGEGPWTVHLMNANGMEDMTDTANVTVYCMLK